MNVILGSWFLSFRSSDAYCEAKVVVVQETVDSVRGTALRRDQRGTRRGWKIVAVLVVLALLLAAVVVGYFYSVGRSFDRGATQLQDEELFTGGQPVSEKGEQTNILLLGSDSRAEDVDYADGAGGTRSDTIIVMNINGAKDSVQIMSIPRDLWVPIEGHGDGKVNAAMSHGGLPLATQTVSDFIDAPIHHVAIIDFEGFKALTDSIGGVEVESDYSFESNGHSFSEGTNELNGEEALDFVRARKNFSDGDLQRGRNQQAFLEGLISKIISADTLSNPTKVAGMVRDFSPYMTVDDRLTSSKIAGMAYDMRSIRSSDVQFFSAPIAGASTSSDGQSILLVDESGRDEIQQAFDDDAVREYAESADDVHL